MLLRVGDREYAQRTGEPVRQAEPAPFPYASFPVERATWKSWRARYPDTDAYTGRPPG